MSDVTLPRVTVNLLNVNAEAMHRAAERTGLSETDTVNRALALYGGMTEDLAAGRAAFSYIDENNEPQRLLLPAGVRELCAALADERRLRKLSNALTIGTFFVAAVVVAVVLLAAG